MLGLAPAAIRTGHVVTGERPATATILLWRGGKALARVLRTASRDHCARHQNESPLGEGHAACLTTTFSPPQSHIGARTELAMALRNGGTGSRGRGWRCVGAGTHSSPFEGYTTLEVGKLHVRERGPVGGGTGARRSSRRKRKRGVTVGRSPPVVNGRLCVSRHAIVNRWKRCRCRCAGCRSAAASTPPGSRRAPCRRT